jgi:DNA-binding transcriptional LysR family regulator
MTDYAEALLLPRLAARLAAAAPGVRVVARTVDRERGLALLDQGRLDCAVGVFPEVPAWQCAEGLFAERYLCLYDPSLLDLELPLAREDYLGLRHVAVSPEEEATGPLDRLLAGHGEARCVAVSTPRYLAVPLILKEAPLLATVPGRLALLASRNHDLAVADPPFDLGTFEMRLVWHRRSEADPGSTWFRGEAAGVARQLR